MDHRKNHRQGFSLILSLTIMAGVVMLVVTLSAFITIESRAAMNQQLATRARLNALVSMRLALAHLQQEAGPDRRSTARADITQPDVSAVSLRNPMWTGVWRTDHPDLPPAWLVSGRGDQPAGTQMVSLFQTGATPDYHEGYLAPWQTDFTAGDRSLVNLVGGGSAAAAEDNRPSGFVTLPKVALPDDHINGNYAYWIGDEGIKARINMLDVRTTDDTSNADQMISLRSPVTPGYQLIEGLGALTNPPQLTRLDSVKQLPLLSGYAPAGTGSTTPDARLLFHDLTTRSAGVLSDSLNGGLKRDLSIAFELSDSQFAATEFGQGLSGAAATTTEKGVEAITMPVLTSKRNQGGQNVEAAPVFSRTASDGQVRGPTWWVLRDYHRLYKQLGWTPSATGSYRSSGTPTLRARTLWPNVATAQPDGPPADNGLHDYRLGNRIYGYSDVYNGDLSTPYNPNASDRSKLDSGRLITRPLNISATPYVQRVSLAFGMNQVMWTQVIKVGRRTDIITWRDFELRLTPTVVIHNPYNVRMTWAPRTTTSSANETPYAAAVSLSDFTDWKFRLRQEGATTFSWEKSLSTLLDQSGTGSDNEDSLRFYLSDGDSPTITLEPGELRTFACQPIVGKWGKSQILGGPFNNQGGLSDLLPYDKDFDDNFNETLPVHFEIIPAGNLRVRHAISCWPGDKLTYSTSPGNSDKLGFFFDNSEVSEVVFTDLNRGKYPSQGERSFPNWTAVAHKYPRKDDSWDGNSPYPADAKPNPSDLITVIDIEAKLSDATQSPFPLFTHSNPMAATGRASAAGRTSSGYGVKGASPSYQLTIRAGGTWTGTKSTDPTRDGTPAFSSFSDGRNAFGGNTSTAGGAQKVILTEIPLVQPVSLAQYTHANFGVRDQQPLFSIANSFATPLVDAKNVLQDNGPNWTEFDQSYLLNTALWDGYFLSSLAPWMKAGTSGTIEPAVPTPAYESNSSPNSSTWKPRTPTTDPNEKKSLAQVISDFVNRGMPLDNPRFTLETSRDPVATTGALADYRRSAAVLLNKGAFNVNSTSVTAWTAFLGSAKNLAIADKASTSPSATNNARFPRVLSKDTAAVATGNLNDPSNWAGFANLSDTQIANLAKAIVAENKARFALTTRTERDLAKAPGPRLFAGLTKATTPYLSLSEFINRFLCDKDWASRCGALQAAIFRADQTYAAGLSDRLFANAADRKVTRDSLTTPTAGWFPNPENIEVAAQTGASRAHVAMGAPGNLLQSDLLQSLGPALATRSDTFTLRCYGEAALDNGEICSAWMEVVAQRVPDFIDTTNVAETGSSAPKPLKIAASAATDPTVSTALTPVNNVLGRRFKVVSMRWLKVDEL